MNGLCQKIASLLKSVSVQALTLTRVLRSLLANAHAVLRTVPFINIILSKREHKVRSHQLKIMNYYERKIRNHPLFQRRIQYTL